MSISGIELARAILITAASALVVSCGVDEQPRYRLHTQCKNEAASLPRHAPGLHFDERRGCVGILWSIPASVGYRSSPPGATSLQHVWLSLDQERKADVDDAAPASYRKFEVGVFFSPPGGIDRARKNALISIGADPAGISSGRYLSSRGRDYVEGKIPVILWSAPDGDFAQCIISVHDGVETIDGACTISSPIGENLIAAYLVDATQALENGLRDETLLSEVEALIVRP